MLLIPTLPVKAKFTSILKMLSNVVNTEQCCAIQSNAKNVEQCCAILSNPDAVNAKLLPLKPKKVY